MSRINVIMPVYNAAPYLSQAIQSICNQTVEDFRLLILDDGSTDESLTIAREHALLDSRIRVYQGHERTQRGPSFPTNELLAITEPDAVYVARMDADDVASKNRIEVQARFLDTHPDVSIVSSRGWLINGNNALIGMTGGLGPKQRSVVSHDTVVALLHSRFNPVIQPAVMWRRGVLEELGGYNTNLTHAEDLELWIRSTKAGCRWAILPDILLAYRIHEGSLSRTGLHVELVAHQRVARGDDLGQSLPSTIGEAMAELDNVMRIRYIVSSIVRSGNSMRAFEAIATVCPAWCATSWIRRVGQTPLVEWVTRHVAAPLWSLSHQAYWSRWSTRHCGVNAGTEVTRPIS